MPAFLILAHRSEAVFGDLFRYVYAPENRYFLHVDAKAPADLQRLARGLAAAFDNVELVESRNCSWGGFSLVAATRDAIRQALKGPGFGHFIILSEQHVPLVAATEIAAVLTPGVSDIQMMALREMDPGGQADVEHRFAWAYRELAGVGMFAAAPRQGPRAIEIYHGSQWMILDEGLCRSIAAAGQEIWAFFASAPLADETALQSIAAMAGARNSGLNRSWVATPERIGDDSMIFAAPHFFEAKADERFLFMRKRADILPAAVRDVLEANAAFSAAALAEIMARQSVALPADRPVMNAAELVLHLRWHLNRLTPDLVIEAMTPPVNAPACYIRLRLPAAALSVCLLSEDMRHFKILLVWPRHFDGDFSDLAVCGLPAVVIRARVYDLAYFREIYCGGPESGFVEMADAADVTRLVAMLRGYVAVLAKLTEAALA
jgi:hypothetical protein